MSSNSYDIAYNNLKKYLEKDILLYTSQRNYDFGPEKRNNVSNLSKFITHRILNEFELIKSVLEKHKLKNVEKFIHEIFWRIYWKGWLENRPKVWEDFIDSLKNIEENDAYVNACNANTKIHCFNEWVKELKNYKYLHNHTRMWFASIWIFTLKLPWQKGAEFFLKHLYDGDPASNTLSWRWVAGLQTKNKNYIAKSWNIEKYSNNRFSNVPLNENALPLEELKTFPLNKINYNENFIKKNDHLLLFENDLCFIERKDLFESYKYISVILLENELRKISLSEKVLNFKKKMILDFKSNFKNCNLVFLGKTLDNFPQQKEFDVIYPSIGENLDFLISIKNKLNLSYNFFFRKNDIHCWKFATKGFFNFKNNIPNILNNLELS